MKRFIFLVFMFFTCNAHAQWETLGYPDSANGLIKVEFPSPMMGYAVALADIGDPSFYKTDDGGYSWSPVVFSAGGDTIISVKDLYFLNEFVGYVLAVAIDYGVSVPEYETIVYKTETGGAYFYRLDNSLYQDMAVRDLHAFESAELILVGGDRIVKTNDDASVWSETLLPGAEFYDVQFISESVGFVAGSQTDGLGNQWGVLLKTNFFGDSWESVASSEVPPINKLDFIDENVGYCLAGTAGELLYKTFDGGLSWVCKELSSGIIDVSIFDDGWGVISTIDGKILYTEDDFASVSIEMTGVHIYDFNEEDYYVWAGGAGYFGMRGMLSISGIREEQRQLELRVGPNPFSERFCVYLEEGVKECSWSLSSVDGRKLKEGKHEGANEFSIEASDLPRGVLVLKVVSGSRSRSIRVLRV